MTLVPPREAARDLADVLLRVVPEPEAEELHELSREVLVGLAAAVGVSVEPDHHGRVARHFEEEIAEGSAPVALEEAHLSHEEPRALHLPIRRGEVPVPEECEFLDRRARREEHAPEPPGSHGSEVVQSLGHVCEEANAVVVLRGLEEELRTSFGAGSEQSFDEPWRRSERCPPGEVACGRTIPVAIRAGTEAFEIGSRKLEPALTGS